MKSTRRSHRHQLALELEPSLPALKPQDPLLLQTLADLLLEALGMSAPETGASTSAREAVDEPETHF